MGTTAGRRLLIVYNPVAGRRRRARFEAALAQLRSLGCAVNLSETQHPGHAIELACAALPEETDVVVAAGGDGTINEVANGLVAGERGPPLAILPLGTANVLAREIGLDASPEAAARTAALGRPRPVTLGRIDWADAPSRYFLAMAGVGFDAHVVAGIRSTEKRRLGAVAYVVEALRQIRRFPHRAYRVEIDGEDHQAQSVIVTNGSRYGGSFVIAPEARIDGPGLHVCLLERGGGWQVPRYGLGLVTGRLPHMAGVRILPARRVRIEAPGSEPIQCDGDASGQLPADFVAVEGALSIVFPPEGAAA